MEMVAAYAKAALDTYPHLAMSVAVLDSGTIEKQHFGGVNTPADNSIYEVGEVTRAFTGTILTSVMGRQGTDYDGATTLVELQQSVNSWLSPSFTGAFPDNITFLSLATHTSGLPYSPSNLPLPLSDADAPFNNPYADYTVSDLSEFMRTWTPAPERPIGSFHESNLGFGILGFVLSRIRLRPKPQMYDSLLADYITTPLGMPDTVVDLTPEQKQRAVTAYLGNDNGPVPGEPGALETPEVPFLQWGDSPLLGGESLKSTLADMVVFMEANLAAAQAPAYRDRVKLPVSLSTAMEIAHGFQAPYSSSSKDGWGVGIGYDVETWTALKANSTLIWRAGNTYGCSAFIAMNAHLQKAVVLLANQGRGNKWSPENIGYAVVDGWYAAAEYGTSSAEGTSLRVVSLALLACFATLLQ